jgi:hypothetical protein
MRGLEKHAPSLSRKSDAMLASVALGIFHGLRHRAPDFRNLAFDVSAFADLPYDEESIPFTAPIFSKNCVIVFAASYKRAAAQSDKCPRFVRVARRCLANLCCPCGRISASVTSAFAASVKPLCRNDVNVNSSRNPAARITPLTLRLIYVSSTTSLLGPGRPRCVPQSRRNISTSAEERRASIFWVGHTCCLGAILTR